jgi:hypothetical protein
MKRLPDLFVREIRDCFLTISRGWWIVGTLLVAIETAEV